MMADNSSSDRGEVMPVDGFAEASDWQEVVGAEPMRPPTTPPWADEGDLLEPEPNSGAGIAQVTAFLTETADAL